MNAETQVRILQIELAKAKAEATQLRKKLGENGRHSRRIDRAYQDALLLATWRIAGVVPSRRYAKRFQITQFRYENAHGLLKLARVIQGRRRWTLDDLATIERKLVKARDRALEDPKAFFLYLNKHAQPCNEDAPM